MTRCSCERPRPRLPRWLGLGAICSLLLGCGARSALRDEGAGSIALDADQGGQGGAGGGSASECHRCDGKVECSHCYVQAYDETYRCPPGSPPPGGSCWDLDELHVDQYGVAFTCFYCP